MAADSLKEREQTAQHGYARLVEIAEAVEKAGFPVGEIITSGTPAFPFAASYEPFKSGKYLHRMSPGTVIYSDMTSMKQLPAEWGYEPAAVVLVTVVCHPKPGVANFDGGHKSVSADAGVPTCMVVGHPDSGFRKGPSEEHLPLESHGRRGSRLLVRSSTRFHATSVRRNNFDDAVIVENGKVVGIEHVTARGHEVPLHLAVVA